MPPLFSIIIPTCNSSLTIKECIESILSQSFSDFEILVMDGLSDDETLNTIKSYNDKRIRIYSEKDSGVYDAMNKGINKANGEWLYFLGSDDRLYDGKVLETIFPDIRKTKKKIVYGNVEITGDSGWAKDGNIYDGYFDLDKLLRKNICHQGIFYHRSVFETMGNYNVSYKICADYDFNLKCYANYKFLYVDLVIAKFTGGNTSFSKTDSKYSEDRWANIANYYKWHLHNKAFTPYLSGFEHLGSEDIVIKIQILIHKIKHKSRTIKRLKI
ncbi:MAG: glycosyltransferase [Prevotella sp.]|jgi:glycosyltransferase involved in cell wall biosynthesis|nr:glycosyltransferase [Prevotella sp.]